MSRDQKSHDIKRVICGPTYSFPGTIRGSIDFASFSLRRCIEGLLWCPWCSKSWSRISGHAAVRVVGLGGNCNRRKFVCARRVLRLCQESPSWHLRNSKLPGSQRDNHFHDNIAGCSMFLLFITEIYILCYLRYVSDSFSIRFAGYLLMRGKVPVGEQRSVEHFSHLPPNRRSSFFKVKGNLF